MLPGTATASGHITPVIPITPIAAAAAASPATLGHGVHAGFWRRFVAGTIDLVVLLVIFGFVDLGYLLLRVIMNIQGDPSIGPGQTWALWIGALGCVLYFALSESSTEQATLGKRAVGIRIVTGDGGRLGFVQSLLRLLAKLVSAAALFLGVVAAAFTPRRQALHDFPFGSLVVSSKAGAADVAAQASGGTMKASTGLVVGSLVSLLLILALAAFYSILVSTGSISNPVGDDPKMSGWSN